MILCHSVIKTRALLLNSCNSVRLVLGGFISGLILWHVKFQPISSNHHIDFASIIFFLTLIASFFSFTLIALIMLLYQFSFSSLVPNIIIIIQQCEMLQEVIFTFIYIAPSLLNCCCARLNGRMLGITSPWNVCKEFFVSCY